jgi:23S rRNA pseudouridine2604 synthase
MSEPVRLSKRMAELGLCSRREADEYIAKGWVTVDGEVIDTLGSKVLPEQVIVLKKAAQKQQEERVTILLHKPLGFVSGQAENDYKPASVLVTAEHQDPHDKRKFHPKHLRGLAPAGRLDIDSTGLLILTQDGRVAKALIGENSKVEKEYIVRVSGKLAPDGLKRLNHGLSLDGKALRPAKVSWRGRDVLTFILQEGKKRQIRRMCELVGLKVISLKRIRIGNVELGDLPMGQWRYLQSHETFLQEA